MEMFKIKECFYCFLPHNSAYFYIDSLLTGENINLKQNTNYHNVAFFILIKGRNICAEIQNRI